MIIMKRTWIIYFVKLFNGFTLLTSFEDKLRYHNFVNPDNALMSLILFWCGSRKTPNRGLSIKSYPILTNAVESP